MYEELEYFSELLAQKQVKNGGNLDMAGLTVKEQNALMVKQILKQGHPVELIYVWSVAGSGQNICSLKAYCDGRPIGNKGLVARCGGGGYDMYGVTFGDFIEAAFQPELLALMENSVFVSKTAVFVYKGVKSKTKKTPYVYISGAAGFAHVLGICESLGLKVVDRSEKTNKGKIITKYSISY